MIVCRRLGFRYSRHDRALEDVDFELSEGQTLGLVGANGSGKSTLLSLLAGLYTPTEGEVGLGPHVSPGDEASLRRLTGLVLQNVDLQILGSTVGEDLLLGLEAEGAEKESEARELARRFGLEARWDEPVQTLSWGQKRKLCICGILMRRPRVLLLDEPFSGLDYPGALEMRKILDTHRQAGWTQVVAVHDLEPLADLADLWAVLEGGALRAFGRADEVFDRLRELGVRPPCSWQAGLGVRPWDWDGGDS